MGRWEPNARGRLERAAMELYVERGFEQTTVTEVAERAGLTQRTFFRHFADKREVLFAGSALFEKVIVDHVAAAPDDIAPIDAVVAALQAAGAMIQEGGGDRARLRQTVIAANPELQERELIKFASVALAIAGALRQRGVPEPAASLTAEAGIAVLKVGFGRWIDQGGEQGLPEALREALEQLKTVTAGE